MQKNDNRRLDSEHGRRSRAGLLRIIADGQRYIDALKPNLLSTENMVPTVPGGSRCCLRS